MLLRNVLLFPALVLAHGVIFENADRHPPLKQGEWFVRVPYASDHVRFWAAAYNMTRMYADRTRQKAAWIPIHRKKVQQMSKGLYKTKPVAISNLTEDQAGALILMNQAREEVGLKPLTWDRELQEDAELHAKFHADNKAMLYEKPDNPWTKALERGFRQTMPAQSFDIRR